MMAVWILACYYNTEIIQSASYNRRLQITWTDSLTNDSLISLAAQTAFLTLGREKDPTDVKRKKAVWTCCVLN